MAFITPQDRNQLQMQSLETSIGKDNPVRFVDAFAEQLEMARLGFSMVESKTEGRPAFRPQTFLKLYLYGYLNGVRSGPRLEKVNGETALIMTVYNMKRAMNILGMEKLLAKLRTWKPDYGKATITEQNRLVLRRYADLNFQTLTKAA